MAFMTTDDLLTELGGVTSRSDARAMISRASRVAGVATGRPLEVRDADFPAPLTAVVARAFEKEPESRPANAAALRAAILEAAPEIGSGVRVVRASQRRMITTLEPAQKGERKAEPSPEMWNSG